MNLYSMYEQPCNIIRKEAIVPLPTLPYRYSPLGAGGAAGRRPTCESNFFSRLRYETHFPTPSSISSGFLSQTEKWPIKLLVVKKKQLNLYFMLMSVISFLEKRECDKPKQSTHSKYQEGKTTLSLQFLISLRTKTMSTLFIKKETYLFKVKKLWPTKKVARKHFHKNVDKCTLTETSIFGKYCEICLLV